MIVSCVEGELFLNCFEIGAFIFWFSNVFDFWVLLGLFCSVFKIFLYLNEVVRFLWGTRPPSMIDLWELLFRSWSWIGWRFFAVFFVVEVEFFLKVYWVVCLLWTTKQTPFGMFGRKQKLPIDNALLALAKLLVWLRIILRLVVHSCLLWALIYIVKVLAII